MELACLWQMHLLNLQKSITAGSSPKQKDRIELEKHVNGLCQRKFDCGVSDVISLLFFAVCFYDVWPYITTSWIPVLRYGTM